MLFAAISLGLALLTKGTAYIYAAPIGIFLAMPLLNARKSNLRRFSLTSAALVSIALIGLLLSAGFFQRNIQSSGHALDSGGQPFFNETKSAVVLGSNAVRNVALHLVTPIPQVTDWQIKSLRWMLGRHLEDPQTTWYGMSFSLVAAPHEDIAGNLLHMITILVAVPFLVVSWVRGRHRHLIAYSFAVFGGALLFCWMLKWQPWHSRLHTPLFAMMAPLIAVAIDSIPRLRRFVPVVLVLFFFYSLPFAFANISRPLISLDWAKLDREKLYFNNNKALYRDYRAATDLLKNERAERVGLFLGGDDWEYPLWALTGEVVRRTGMNFQYVQGNGNPTSAIDVSSLPAHVVATIPLEQWQYHADYHAIYSSETVSVFRLQSDLSESK
jgi:hypothetical protein